LISSVGSGSGAEYAETRDGHADEDPAEAVGGRGRPPAFGEQTKCFRTGGAEGGVSAEKPDGEDRFPRAVETEPGEETKCVRADDVDHRGAPRVAGTHPFREGVVAQMAQRGTDTTGQ